MATSPPWQQNAQHRYYQEADILVVDWNGDVTADEMQHFIGIESVIQLQYGYVLNLNLVHPKDNIGAKARSVAAEGIRAHGIRLQAAVVGANLITRTIATMLIRCASLISRQPLELAFFPAEARAREWMAERRRILSADQPPPARIP